MKVERIYDTDHLAYVEWQVARDMIIKAARVADLHKELVGHQDLIDAIKVESAVRRRFMTLMKSRQETK